MEESENKKSSIHIHTGGLILFIIILIILFKVDIKSKIHSPQFQNNVTYIENGAKDFWTKYVLNPIKSKTGEVFTDYTNKGVQELQNTVNQKLNTNN